MCVCTYFCFSEAVQWLACIKHDFFEQVSLLCAMLLYEIMSRYQEDLLSRHCVLLIDFNLCCFGIYFTVSSV